DFALFGNTTGADNTAVGDLALESNTTGVSNTAVGTAALASNTTADNNTATGYQALFSNTTGFSNTAIGNAALQGNVIGESNVAVGDGAGNLLTSSFNVLIGAGAGSNLTTGGDNIMIGAGTTGFAGESNTIRVANDDPQVAGTSSKVFFGGVAGATVGAANQPVLINANGQLGTGVSSARFKKDIESMGKSSEAIFGLRPVRFHYKQDETNMPCFGLIAEEVGKVNPDLILLDK